MSTEDPLSSATDKVKNFFDSKIDDAKYYAEKKQRQFEISDSGTSLDRAKADTKSWFDQQKRELETKMDRTKQEFEKATGIPITPKTSTANETKSKGKSAEDDIPGCENFTAACSSCGLFST